MLGVLVVSGSEIEIFHRQDISLSICNLINPRMSAEFSITIIVVSKCSNLVID